MITNFRPRPRRAYSEFLGETMSGPILRRWREKKREKKAAKAEKRAAAEAAALAKAEAEARKQEAIAHVANVLDEARARKDAVAQAEAEAELAAIQAESAAGAQKTLMVLGGIGVAGIILFMMVKK